MVWLLISRILLISLGVMIGVSLMCLLQIGRESDRKMKEIQRRNEE